MEHIVAAAGHESDAEPLPAPAARRSQLHTARIYRGLGELIDHVFASHRLVNPDTIPAVEIVAASPLPSMTDDPSPQTSAPSDHAAMVATFSL